MNVAVVGLGLIGGSVALDLRAAGFASGLVGVESNPAHAQRALELGLVDRIETLESAAAAADVLVLATPVDILLRILPAALEAAGPSTTVTDMGSTKAQLCASVIEHPRRRQYVAAHPMAGTENSGPNAALRHLFANKVAVICEAQASAPEHVERVNRLFGALRMRLVQMGAEEHDLHAAYVSHLPHVCSYVLAHSVLAKERNVNTIFDLASGGFESTVRLAKSAPHMWGPIFEQNSKNVLEALELYIEHLQLFHRTLVAGEHGELRTFMEGASEIRRVLQRMQSGRAGES